MNYYLKIKSTYDPSCNYDNVEVLSNGYVFKNTYYPTIDQLNANFYQTYHIGKSSAGWYFILASYPKIHLTTLADWIQKILLHTSAVIVNENNEELTLDELLSIITERSSPDKPSVSSLSTTISLGKNNLLKNTDPCFISDHETGSTYVIANNADFS